MPDLKPIPNRRPFLVPKREEVEPQVHAALCSAINARRQISFLYQGKSRLAEPPDYGIQNGNPRLLIYQTGGASSSGRLPDWRWIDVVKIADLEVLDQTFPGNRTVPPERHHRWEQVFARVEEPE